MSERLILIRHGETVHNVAGITQGWSDSNLSERGQSQVQRLAQRIAALGPTALYSSPLGRAMSTAQAVAAESGLPIAEHEDLREMNYGGWEGRAFLDIRSEDEEIFNRWITEGSAACPGGESHEDVRERMARGLEQVWNATNAEGGRTVVVVSHGTAIRIAATALLQLPVMASRQFAQDNAAINIFLRRGDRWLLKVWNDATHCGE